MQEPGGPRERQGPGRGPHILTLPGGPPPTPREEQAADPAPSEAPSSAPILLASGWGGGGRADCGPRQTVAQLKKAGQVPQPWRVP